MINMTRFTKILLYLFLLFTLPACSLAQKTPTNKWQLETAVQWLVSIETKLYALDRLGTITEIDVVNGNSQVVATDSQGIFLSICKDDVVFTDAEGKLATVFTTWQGPEVSALAKVTCLASGNIAVLDNDGHLLSVDAQGKVVHQLDINALRDAQLSQADIDNDGSNEIIVLTAPTDRYAHGVLGDRLEAESIVAVDSESFEIKASFSLTEPFVFEQLRVTPLVTQGRTLLLGTRSSRQTGAGVIALEFQDNTLVQVGEAGVIGLGNRWLNLFDTSDGSQAGQHTEAYAIRTPHIGGPLQRYSFVDGELQLSAEDLGVTNHRIGSRNLDLAVLHTTGDNTLLDNTLLAAPQHDQRTIEIFSCARSAKCTSEQSYKLDATLSSNLIIQTIASQTYVVAADRTGSVYVLNANLDTSPDTSPDTSSGN